MPNPPEPHAGAQAREQAEPSERSQPIPLIVTLVTLAVVMSGVAYILLTESFGPAGMGDRRTLADLRATTAQTGQGGQAVDGGQIYAANCVACHQAGGKGLPGVFPPLDGSEWVSGDARILANILLHGIEGEMSVGGQVYRGSMPAFGRLGDAELAAVLSHVRGAWGNKSAPVTADVIANERRTVERTTPFAGEAELKALAAKLP